MFIHIKVRVSADIPVLYISIVRFIQHISMEIYQGIQFEGPSEFDLYVEIICTS